MKISRVIINGVIIYIAIAAFFLLMEMFGMSDNVWLRLFNFIFVIYGINRTIKQNYDEHIYGYLTNIKSAFLTGVVSLALTVLSFIGYVEYKGGDEYLHHFVEKYIFAGKPSIYQFAFGLTLEGLAATAIVSFALMQYWKDKVEKINEVDDVRHVSH
ncbi:hypothetical protein [Flavobacterium rhizosphaerae]|uniref:DUF4199 domain-containing protein n=1 Tax=Flavobacterium rhizosphaerae TaxID=3163298 RepID=A0ABW8YSF8_9FLAO